MNINQYTTMNWGMEIDYHHRCRGARAGRIGKSCFPASGEGWATDIGGSSSNYLDYQLRASFAQTPWGDNQTYTGSLIITTRRRSLRELSGRGNHRARYLWSLAERGGEPGTVQRQDRAGGAVAFAAAHAVAGSVVAAERDANRRLRNRHG